MTIMKNESWLNFNKLPLNYFYAYGLLWSCDGIFNWKAVDPDGVVWLYKEKPILRLTHWSAYNTIGMPLTPELAEPITTWARSLITLSNKANNI